MFGGNFAPEGWRFCDGETLLIAEYENLFQYIGTTYGGDGEDTFALPDLRGRIPIHQGNGFFVGETAGTEEVTLTTNQIPQHNHTLLGSDASASTTNPRTGILAESERRIYSSAAPGSTLGATSVSASGGSQPHSNMQPFLCVNFIISTEGVGDPDPEESLPFLAEIRILPYADITPYAWDACEGQLLPIAQNTALFSLMGTIFGGDGFETFALPDLRGMVPMQPGQGGGGLTWRLVGELGGSETVSLLNSEMPAHPHSLRAVDAAGSSNDPQDAHLARAFGGDLQMYQSGSAGSAQLQSLGLNGGSLPHNNFQPTLAMKFCIARQGIFPELP